MAQHIIVKEYDANYPSMFEKEKEQLVPSLKDNLVDVFHIGSTAVPGLSSKPIIDIMISVNSLEKVDEKKNEFKEIGYEYLGEYGIKGRRYLRKGGDERTHQVHIFHKDDTNNLKRHLAFRDFLIAHKDIADKYGKLKRELAIKYSYDIDKYCDGKEDFVKDIEKVALKWYSNK